MNIIKTEPTSDADDVVPHPPPARRNPNFLTLNMHDDTVDYFQDSDADATLSGRATADSPEQEYLYLDRESEESVLVRTAMKRSNQERQVSEPEKWVRYSEVVENREEEVTSCSAAPLIEMNVPRSLALKLDYQEILDAWSGKGSLYIVAHQDGDQCPQTVPDYNNFTVVKESVRNLWSVPDNECNISSMKMDEDGGKAGQREASVLRYKEKRQNRLFSKRIRYEVRKLNAEKRPRMKGRFVKRN